MALGAVACSLGPTAKVDKLAHRAGLSRDVVQGLDFRHVVYGKESLAPGEELHVYIDGDGNAYRSRFQPSADPATSHPLALELMLKDPAPALYLGRPCYLGLAQDAGCEEAYWTLRRFSPEVVASMARVLRMRIDATGAKRVTLIGYSGGAALALLIADDIPEVNRIVTVSGNLDVAGWVHLHGYTPLAGSLDPLTDAGRRTDVMRIHYAGAQDENIPPAMIAAAAAKLGDRVHIVKDFTHECCWTRIWPAVLQDLTADP
jgi:pimeloyl-ACP methyl ester carboxylesterase